MWHNSQRVAYVSHGKNLARSISLPGNSMLNALMHVLLLHLPQRFVGNVHNAKRNPWTLIHQMAHVHPSTSHSAFFFSRTRKGI
jgi:hypothetical protein